MIYDDFLSPVLENMPAGKEMRAAVGSDSVMILFYDNLAQLVKFFERYAEESDEGGINEGLSDEEGELSLIPNGAMNCQQFGQFAADAGFVNSSILGRKFSALGVTRDRKHSIMGNRIILDNKYVLTQKDARQIFAASQHDSGESESEQRGVADDDQISSHQQLMIFSEFLEAVARLGVLKYQRHPKVEGAESEQEEILSHYECIKLAVEISCDFSKSIQSSALNPGN